MIAVGEKQKERRDWKEEDAGEKTEDQRCRRWGGNSGPHGGEADEIAKVGAFAERISTIAPLLKGGTREEVECEVGAGRKTSSRDFLGVGAEIDPLSSGGSLHGARGRQHVGRTEGDSFNA